MVSISYTHCLDRSLRCQRRDFDASRLMWHLSSGPPGLSIRMSADARVRWHVCTRRHWQGGLRTLQPGEPVWRCDRVGASLRVRTSVPHYQPPDSYTMYEPHRSRRPQAADRIHVVSHLNEMHIMNRISLIHRANKMWRPESRHQQQRHRVCRGHYGSICSALEA